ncbi:hypothetical protein PHYPSEUDO_014110 [Phytophthora pseudosyringae]|uniref:Uncharacterized protein n=1 Tax=Phytophthora pseudosyringae TaxID=221518 RepID=A0A8T1W0U5_9STRA|nr:hypothetical protein PHYPSEUDO_014110 [Phytophthora pseudosyringae]
MASRTDVTSSTLEAMRMNTSYVEDFNGAAVLDTIARSRHSSSSGWRSTPPSLPQVSSRTVTTCTSKALAERLGYHHVMHSVNFPQPTAHPQQHFGACLLAVMDPGGDMIRMIIVPAMVGAFLSSVKYAYCGQMKKLVWMLERRYEESKQHGAPNKKSVYVTCSAPIAGRRIGDVGKSRSTCKACFGFVGHVRRNLSYVDPHLLLSQRKVT